MSFPGKFQIRKNAPPVPPPSTAAGKILRVRETTINKSTVRSTAAGCKASLNEILGRVAETPSAHRRRHNNYNEYCTRCTYYKYEDKWNNIFGAPALGRKPYTRHRSWLRARPVQLGGTWALGCRLCSLAAQKLQGRPMSNPKSHRWNK